MLVVFNHSVGRMLGSKVQVRTQVKEKTLHKMFTESPVKLSKEHLMSLDIKMEEHFPPQHEAEPAWILKSFPATITHFTLHCYGIRVGLGIPQITQARP